MNKFSVIVNLLDLYVLQFVADGETDNRVQSAIRPIIARAA